MKTLIKLFALFATTVFFISCGQKQAELPNGSIKTEINDIGPNMMVRNIKKGSNGTILLAGPNNSSFGDVFRYDPSVSLKAGEKAFTNLTNKIGSHRFMDVLEDRRGNMWFTTTDSGVYFYPSLSAGGKSIHHFTTKDGLADNQVTCVYEDKAGNIWFGTANGLSRYNDSAKLKGGKAFQNFKSPNAPLFYKEEQWNNEILTIIEDKTGKLWVGTRGDAFVFDPSATLKNGKKKYTTLTHNGDPFLQITCIMEDKNGYIWLSGYNGFKGYRRPGGLYRYDQAQQPDSLKAGGGTFTKISERGAYAIIQDRNGNIWTTGPVNPANQTVQALTLYDAKSIYSTQAIETEFMSGRAFYGLLEAEDGSIWFGDATGAYRYDPSATLKTGVKTITDFYNKQGQKKYIIDTKQSAVVWKGSSLLGGWEGSKFLGDGSQTGDVDISKGELLVENRHLVGGAGEVNMTTIENFVDQRSLNQLPPFFDVKKFPVSTFKITKVETLNEAKVPNDGSVRVNEGKIKITGNLTMEGITKEVTFPATMYFKDGMDGTVELKGSLIIDRTEWGINYASEKHFDKSGEGTISDEVKLFMKIVGKKVNR